MGVITRDGVLEVIVSGEMENQAHINILHFAAENIVPPGVNLGLEEALEGIAGWYRSNLLPELLNINIVEYVGRVITGTETVQGVKRLTFGDQAIIAGGTPADSAPAGDSLPSFNAYGIRKFARNAGRDFRGNMRLGGVAEADTFNNEIAFVKRGKVQLALDAILTGVNTPGDDNQQYKVLLAVFAETSYLRVNVTEDNTPIVFTSRVEKLILNKFVTSQVSRKQRAGFN